MHFVATLCLGITKAGFFIADFVMEWGTNKAYEIQRIAKLGLLF